MSVGYISIKKMEGSLSKWTNVMKGWQYRWFILDENTGLLSYYTSREKMMKGVRRGCVRLKGAVIGIDDEENTMFTITVDGKTFHFQARNCDEREKWIRCLEDTIIRHEFGCHSSGSSMDYNKIPPPTLQQFDKEVSEADAYLQLLIDQVKALETRVQEQNIIDREKETCEIIINNAKLMLEEIKHTIVLLQIAKNSAFPVDGTYHSNRETQSLCSLPNDDSKSDIEVGTEITDSNQLGLYMLPASANYGYSLDVPDVSYSSSDEENYYDACENDDDLNDNSNSDERINLTPDDVSPGYRRRNLSECSPSVTPKGSPSISTNDTTASGNGNDCRRESVVSAMKPTSGSLVVPLLPDGSIDFDALYEDPSENELESQPSVIKHLISQVKIGMDLTKVVLPTFILERRSLLEMYSDYFAHPDIFLKAVDLQSPKDRMVQIVKWYLSSYHAGRKSSVARKPYNPVLGEIFRCWWDVDEVTDDRIDSKNSAELNANGPVWWCTNDQLVFVAEQVSHHPPISAFYAEHVNKKVSLCAYVWTKSKFLGLSVGVHNIGCATVRLIEHKEEYTFTFPNGYGRSILTVPWIELGGNTYIKCAQTGYYCNIEFLTKPFYGGKKHRIAAEVFGPKEKKPFLTISGEWNGVMEAKWTDGPTEIFLDTRKMPVNKKKVKKIEEQEDNESRKVWKMVTLGLKYNDVEQATSAKMQIEQKQRDEAQLRKENNEHWNPRWFYEEDGAWIYKNPLEKRLNVQFEKSASSGN